MKELRTQIRQIIQKTTGSNTMSFTILLSGRALHFSAFTDFSSFISRRGLGLLDVRIAFVR